MDKQGRDGAVTRSSSQEGVYFIDGQTWQVGPRYTLHRVLGTGSFSCVCLAFDNDINEWVALKRIADVLNSIENAKRVLREVCILRRLRHPHIIQLKDVFIKPSATGKYVYRKGQLVSTSLDLYLALEYCDQGDLFHMRGQLSETEVKHIMYQLLSAVLYLHAYGVWHRDIKSANTLITLQDGARHLKLADLGSARSALSEGYQHAEQQPVTTPADLSSLPEAPIHHNDSFLMDNAAQTSPRELYVQPAPGPGGGFTAPLTRVVCTPCYRAPEVVMSRGGYTSAIDMWSVGCVFGELLQRAIYIGHASTPQLQVAPVFAIRGMPMTPPEGESFAEGPANSTTRLELDALFAVIGTPAWSCIEGVQSPAWRKFLKKIPGKAPTLFRRFGAAGEPAVDLLARMLTFDPARRCSAEEALSHEYFADVRAALASAMARACAADADAAVVNAAAAAAAAVAAVTCRAASSGSSSGAVAAGSGGGGGVASKVELQMADSGGLGRGRAPSRLQRVGSAGVAAGVVGSEGYSGRGTGAAAAGNGALAMDVDAGTSGEVAEAQRTDATRDASTSPSRQQPPSTDRARTLPSPVPLKRARCQHYYEITDDPAAALAGLEEELVTMLGGQHPDTVAPGAPIAEAVRALLEREVSEHQALLAARRGMAPAKPLPASSSAPSSPRALAAGPTPSIARQWQHLRPDMGTCKDPSVIALERLPYHADSKQASLDTETHLRAGRHGEWAEALGGSGGKKPGGARGGGTWGVSLLPPGMDENEHPELVEVIRTQNKR